MSIELTPAEDWELKKQIDIFAQETLPPTLSSLVVKQNASIQGLQARVQELEQALLDAAGEVDDWGSYATDYFQKRHDLPGCVQAIKDKARGGR